MFSDLVNIHPSISSGDLKPSKPSESKDVTNLFVESNSQTLSACFEIGLLKVFRSGLGGGFGKKRKKGCEPAKERMFF